MVTDLASPRTSYNPMCLWVLTTVYKGLFNGIYDMAMWYFLQLYYLRNMSEDVKMISYVLFNCQYGSEHASLPCYLMFLQMLS